MGGALYSGYERVARQLGAQKSKEFFDSQLYSMSYHFQKNKSDDLISTIDTKKVEAISEKAQSTYIRNEQDLSKKEVEEMISSYNEIATIEESKPRFWLGNRLLQEFIPFILRLDAHHDLDLFVHDSNEDVYRDVLRIRMREYKDNSDAMKRIAIRSEHVFSSSFQIGCLLSISDFQNLLLPLFTLLASPYVKEIRAAGQLAHALFEAFTHCDAEQDLRTNIVFVYFLYDYIKNEFNVLGITEKKVTSILSAYASIVLMDDLQYKGNKVFSRNLMSLGKSSSQRTDIFQNNLMIGDKNLFFSEEQANKKELSIEAIIFDIGGVLLKEAEEKLGIKIYHTVFKFLEEIEPERDHKREFIMNLRSGSEFLEIIQNNIDKPEYSNFFANEKDRNAVKNGAAYIFIAEIEAKNTELGEEAYMFVKECKDNHIRILAFSNWQPDAFNLIQTKFKSLFDLFDERDIFIPVNIGAMKPDENSYQHIIKVANLNPIKTLFIDDGKKNVEGANNCGLQGLLHKDWQTTRQELQSRGFRFRSNYGFVS